MTDVSNGRDRRRQSEPAAPNTYQPTLHYLRALCSSDGAGRTNEPDFEELRMISWDVVLLSETRRQSKQEV